MILYKVVLRPIGSKSYKVPLGFNFTDQNKEVESISMLVLPLSLNLANTFAESSFTTQVIYEKRVAS